MNGMIGECPECNGRNDTENVFTDDWTEVIKKTWICNGCDIQFTETYWKEEVAIDERF